MFFCRNSIAIGVAAERIRHDARDHRAVGAQESPEETQRRAQALDRAFGIVAAAR
jgi:hypothetical protein